MNSSLVLAEMHRALHRRVVWTLLVLAGAGIAVLAVVAYTSSSGVPLAELRADGHPAVLTHWWQGDGGDSVLMVALLPLVIGGLLGGASVAGGEWKAGTVATVLTWEPRRRRLHGARTISAFVAATAIALALQAILLVAAAPAVMAHGTTGGGDAAWWLGLSAAMVRVALVTGLAAVVGLSLATLGRSTTFALGAVFAWMAVVENLVRVHKPSWQPLLLGDNATIVTTWAQLDAASFTRSTAAATVTVLAYAALVVAAAVATFARRDVAAA